jgi:serine-type D-Ala-D-Ala carboxypeptidase (penicillin-binding protein 5/6)
VPTSPEHPRRASTGPSGVQARAAAIAVAATGQVLWSRDLNTEVPIASITKVMTALVVIRAGNLSRKIRIPSAVVGYVQEHDASSAGLIPGDTLTASQVLEGLLLPSGADAAYALAEAYGPGLGKFIAKMNATATSAVFRSVVDRRTYQVRSGGGHHAYFRQNLNPLLGVYRGAVGIKTGYTPAAGHCLLFEVTRGGRSFIGVDLGSPGIGTTVNGADATRMLNWAFSLPGY